MREYFKLSPKFLVNQSNKHHSLSFLKTKIKLNSILHFNIQTFTTNNVFYFCFILQRICEEKCQTIQRPTNERNGHSRLLDRVHHQEWPRYFKVTGSEDALVEEIFARRFRFLGSPCCAGYRFADIPGETAA